ncbi:MAG: citrate (Si)-synthase [Candidatus Latescibacteria bacterium]|nr:citrate (Si)-synthase [Candidatus Latescibacterota bacterium]NIM21582.1 citrate (Si)-synthase [Candidatus Latescibacterota bacterium]NIM64561.1 citrate (Si)-synthase [Candidatus Latescibacterota bacterium]NIO01076.1 citrate (Si)-synthase [Candidatus Latescibacterota bacterium]NIO27469.1 citrate (Si)-synthase [Candidatus Latescibacterota bacterium]
MSALHEKFASQIPKLREERQTLLKGHGDKQISEVTVAQAFGGMRGVKGLICDTSLVEPDKGLIIRGIPILELTEKLPEEIFFLLITGELPNEAELKDLQKEYSKRGKTPDYVWKVLEAMPKESHPMAMLDTAILVMENESEFRKRYTEGMKKTDYWEPALEDSLNLLAVLPEIAAGIYRMRYDKGPRIPRDPNLDWGANYAHMLGNDDEDFYKAMRLYLVLHSDHEGGNVSAFSCHTVGSALSDPFYSVSAGLNGLAGPLHGLANQECLGWILSVIDKFDGVPTDEQLEQYAWDTLNSGQVIPGYGHAVLRCPDPRFVAFIGFGEKYCADDNVYQTVSKVYRIVPEVLKKHGKAANPWPNVDAGSGSILYHFGLREFPYYTVLFSVSRAMGMTSQLVINRALGTAITRPKSVGTDWVAKQMGS